MLNRRRFVALATLGLPVMVHAANSRLSALPTAFGQLERINGGRLGIGVINTATGEQVNHRGDERFPMCSTFKFLLAAAILQRVDHQQETLERTVLIPPEPLLSHSPLTAPHAGGNMTLAALCDAILTQSDNTAANLLLGILGGPPGITNFARTLGDDITRLDRTELALNESLAGDPRDTTSPVAMAGNLKTVLLGSALSVTSRARLTNGMVRSQTGLDRLRAKLPGNWRAGDKTGTNGTHTSNDIAVFWPPAGQAVIVTAYITQCSGPESKRAALLANIGRLVMGAVA
jgi:beta-lactamase class A